MSNSPAQFPNVGMVMEWNKQYEDALLAQLEGGEDFPAGVASKFIPLTDGVGVKLFPSAVWRDFAWRKQVAVYAYALAPQPGGVTNLRESVGQHAKLGWRWPFGTGLLRWGYLTQRAEMRSSYDCEMKQRLITALKSIPELQTPVDLEEQDDNFGLIQGKLVFLDFDHGSWNSELPPPD